MKILYVSPGFIPSHAANSVHVMKMAQALAISGNNVSLAYTPGSAMPEAEIFNHYGVKPVFKLSPLSSFWPRRFIFSLKACLQSVTGNFDLVFSRCTPSAYLCTLLGKKTVLEIHESPDNFSAIPRWMFMRMIEKPALAGLVVISSALKDNVLALSDIVPEKIIVSHDGADSMAGVKPAVLGDAGNYGCHIGYTGHLYKGRGIEVILYLASEFPDCCFHIVGGNAQDVEYWRQTCLECPNIRFYGHLPHVAIASYIAAFDILLAPYQKKVAVHGGKGDTAAWMSPLKIFEYMASGKPIICSDIPVLREVLTDGQNCALCPPEDRQAWKTALSRLKDDPALAISIGAAALAEFELTYTWKARAAAILKDIGKTA